MKEHKLKRLAIHNLNQICQRVSCPAKSQDMTNEDNPFTPCLTKKETYMKQVNDNKAGKLSYTLPASLSKQELFKAICCLPRQHNIK